MIFVKMAEKWKDAKTQIPKNNENQYYAVTLARTSGQEHKMVAEEYWRYFGDCWEMYFDGKWKPLTNKLWEVAAYIEIQTLMPYVPTDMNQQFDPADVDQDIKDGLPITNMLWRYSINDGEAGGIVIATSKETALAKVKAAYSKESGWVSEHSEEPCIFVWPSNKDFSYCKKYSDIIECY